MSSLNFCLDSSGAAAVFMLLPRPLSTIVDILIRQNVQPLWYECVALVRGWGAE